MRNEGPAKAGRCDGFRVVFALLCIAGISLPANAQTDWVEIRSPHLVLVSNAGEETALGVVDDFGRVRALVQHVGWTVLTDPGRPVVAMAVRDEDSLRELLPAFWEHKGPRPVGAFWRGPHAYHVAIRVDASRDARYRRVVHEYVHLLTSARFPEPPAWLDEGLSELWGNVDERDGRVHVGRPNLDHLRTLRRTPWLPLEELLGAARNPHERDPQGVSILYAQSWALVHYLLLGTPGGSPGIGSDAIDRYLELLGEEVEQLEAAERAFGDLAALEEAVEAYVQAGGFREVSVAASSGPAEAGRYNSTALTPAEALAARGSFVVYGERPAAALPLLTEALRLDANQPLALESLGYFYFQDNRPVEAARYFDRVIDLGSAGYLAYFYRAILTQPNLIRDGGDEDQWTRVETDLRRTLELNENFAPAYARLADVIARGPDEGRLQEAAGFARRAVELEPNTPGYRDLLEALNRPGER